jgi:hypothetical protein
MFDNLEIRMLICKRDLQMGLNMIHSLRKCDIFKTIPIYFHDDGTLDSESKHILLEVENSHIIDKEYADSKVSEYLINYKSCKRYRFDNARILYNTKMKLIDVYFLSKSKNILCIDSDILFLNEPITIIDLIGKSTPFYFPDFQNSYSYCKTSKVDVLDKVNTGIFYIPNETYYNIDVIEFALNDLFTIGIANTPHWIEQSAYSHMFYKDGRYVKLDNQKYQIPNPYDDVPSNIESLHFVSHPPIRGLHNDFLKREYLYKEK